MIFCSIAVDLKKHLTEDTVVESMYCEENAHCCHYGFNLMKHPYLKSALEAPEQSEERRPSLSVCSVFVKDTVFDDAPTNACS